MLVTYIYPVLSSASPTDTIPLFFLIALNLEAFKLRTTDTKESLTTVSQPQRQPQS